jgi:replicative DNA helicase
VQEAAESAPQRLLVVVDYLQKIPVDWSDVQAETEVTTYLTQGLKELAMAMGVRVIAIAASDREGLKAKRMRLSDLRGSSAVQYEADVGLILNNKWAIISREHLVYNPTQAETMRNFVVMSVEKNRAGRNAVDMEYPLDAAHFRIVPTGSFVRERLVDEKVVMA